MSRLPQLKSRLHSRIHAIEDLLAEMRTPVQNPNQELLYAENIRRINGMISETKIDSLDIETNYKNDINTTELEDFKTSLHTIKCMTAAAYMDLCTWKATNTKASVRAGPLPNQTPGDAQPRKKKTAPQTRRPHQPGLQQGLRATHAKPGHTKNRGYKAQKINTSRRAPRVEGPPHYLSNLATTARPARPLKDGPRAHEENQDINSDVLDTKDHPTTRNHTPLSGPPDSTTREHKTSSYWSSQEKHGIMRFLMSTRLSLFAFACALPLPGDNHKNEDR